MRSIESRLELPSASGGYEHDEIKMYRGADLNCRPPQADMNTMRDKMYRGADLNCRPLQADMNPMRDKMYRGADLNCRPPQADMNTMRNKCIGEQT